jgi:hypothetical protein
MAPANWQPPVDAAVQVPARLRNGSPLLVERTFGAGRVMVCTTTAAPLWNNWARNPSFVVTLLELQAYLSAAGNAPTWQLVGTPIRLRLDPARYQSHGRWQRPDDAATDAPSIDFPVDANGLNVVLADTPTAGVYQLHLTTQDGQAHVRRWALDIDPQDSPLQLADPTRIATQLPDVDLEFRNAADIAPRADTPSGVNLSDLCLYLLVGLLVGELGLARAASYLPGTAGVSGTRNRGAA